jgi:predicted lipid-binding transport protein (Tim44 family)
MLDILFFACLAGFIIYRLYIVLGQKDDDEEFEGAPIKSHLKVVGGKDIADLEREKVKIPTIKGYKKSQIKEVVKTFEEIKEYDEEFDEIYFVIGARKAFEMVLKALALSDKLVLGRLLSEEIYQDFVEEINKRQDSGEDLVTTLIGMESSDIIRATIQNDSAFITVRFITEQTNILKNIASGEILSGSENQIETIEDVWTFTRNLRSTNPAWLLCATETL